MNKNYYIAPSEIHGDGLFARVDFKKGGMVGLAHVNDQPATEIGKFHNHDEKNPTMISKKIGNKRYVYANQDLKAGTELTTNYRMQPELGQPEEFDVPKAQDGIFLSSGKFRPQTNTIGSTLGFKKVFPKRDTTWSLTGNVGYGKNLEADKEGLAASINAENFGKFFGGQRRVNAVTNLEAFLEPDNYGGQFTAGPNLHWGTHPKRSLPRGTGRLDFQPFNLRVGYQSTPYQTDSGDALFDNATGRISWGYGTKLKGEYKPKLKGRFRPTLFGDLGVDADFLMQDYDQDKIDAGSITSSNEGFKIKPSFSANLGIRVPIDGSRLRRRRRPDPVEEDDVYYNPGIRTSDPNSVEAYEEPEAYQEGGPIIKQRKGVRENFDHSVWTPSGEFSKPSSVSSHLMAAEEVPGRGWVGFPTLFQGNPYVENESMLSTNVGEWLDMSDQNNGWWPIYEEADRRGEVYDFGEDKEAALAFGEGSWKDQLPIEIELSDEEVERYRAGGYIIEEI